MILAGRYRILGLIGRGGMGRVWRAYDTDLDREVAVKELRLSDEIDEDGRREWYARAGREARAVARLSHPGIVALHDRVVGDDGRPWLVMELIDGGSLDDVLRTAGPLPVPLVADIGRQMLDALVAAHAKGVVHRDVKPANVLLDRGRAVLTDFGIATMDGDATLTQTGAHLGTPAYMSPEQIRGEAATPRSDLWALGATLYAAVEGRPPFEGATHGAIFVAVATTEPRPPAGAGPLADVIIALLSKDPGARPAPDAVREILTAHAGPPGAPLGTGPAPVPGPALHGVTTSDTAGTGAPVTPLRRRLRGRTGIAIAGAVVALAIAVPVVGLALRTETGGTDTGGTAKPSPRAGAATPSRHVGTATPSPRSGTAAPSRRGDVPADRPLDTGADEVVDVAFSPDAKMLASADNSGAIELWDTATARRTATLVESGDAGNYFKQAVAFSPDGKTLAAQADDNVIQYWQGTSRKTGGTVTVPRGESVTSAVFSPDGATLAVGSSRGTDDAARIRLWDIATRRFTAAPPVTRDTVIKEPAFSPDGRTLAYGDGTDIRFWDVPGRQQEVPIDAGHAVNAVAFGPDGKTVAATFTDGAGVTPGIWDIATGKPARRFAGGTGGKVAFSPDGRYLAAGEGRVWDARTGESLHAFASADGKSAAVAFSPDGRALAGCADDGVIHLWRL